MDYLIPERWSAVVRGVMEDGLLLLALMAGEIGDLIVRGWLRTKEAYKDVSEKVLFTAQKKRTGLLKIRDRYIHPHWRWFTYWETFGGYKEPKPIADFAPDAVAWLCTPMELGGPLGADLYADMMFVETGRYLKSEWHPPRRDPDVVRWSLEGMWTRGKSLRRIKPTTKLMVRATKSDSDILKELFEADEIEEARLVWILIIGGTVMV